nr:peptidoglycan-binding domain-containing protein [uncultured Blautia sp.]
MKKNRVFNILFIIFTVMVVVGIVSMVKTVVMPKEDVQDTDGFVVEDETTDEPEVVAKNEEGKKKKQPENNSQNEKLDITKDVNKKSGPTETPVVVTETPAPTEDPSIEYTDADTVRKVQEKLNALGAGKYNCGDVDGIPGEGTKKAIRNYQADNSLISDGRITDKLLEKLGIAVPEGNQEEASDNNADIPENTSGDGSADNGDNTPESGQA